MSILAVQLCGSCSMFARERVRARFLVSDVIRASAYLFDWMAVRPEVSFAVRIPAIPAIPSISPGPTPHASRTTKPTWPTALPTGKCWNGLICGVGILRMFPESSVFFLAARACHVVPIFWP